MATATTINWSGSKLEYRIISRIAKRAAAELDLDSTQAEMDVMACHLNGCPLNLEVLEHFERYEFAHDILGIRKHIDRSTGQLTGFFVPRSADSEQQTDSDAEM